MKKDGKVMRNDIASKYFRWVECHDAKGLVIFYLLLPLILLGLSFFAIKNQIEQKQFEYKYRRTT